MLIELIQNMTCVSLIGMCKNSGKTTALTRLLRELDEKNFTVAITSIGRDGESADIVTGTEKPSVFVRAGTLVATAQQLLPECFVTREILDTTDISTPMGKVVLFRALSHGDVQIAGPSISSQLMAVRDLFTHFSADKILIDGALGRRATASTLLSEGTILCTGASLHPDIDTVVADTVFVYNMLSLPECQFVLPHANADERTTFHGKYVCITDSDISYCSELSDISALVNTTRLLRLFLSGAFTDTIANHLIKLGRRIKGLEVVAADSSKILFSRRSYEKLKAQGIFITVERKTAVTAVTVNPISAYGWKFDKTELKNKLQTHIDVPVLNVRD